MENFILEAIDEQEENLLVKLRKPVDFEGKTYTELDLSAMEDMSARDLKKISKLVRVKDAAVNPALMEMSMEYAMAAAAMAAKLPIEFFDKLGAKDAMKVKNTVVSFLFAED